MQMGGTRLVASHQPAAGRFVCRTAEEQALEGWHDKNCWSLSQVLGALATALWQEPGRSEAVCAGGVLHTTGVQVDGKVRTRPRIVGHCPASTVSEASIRYPLRMINSVFECAEPCIWQGQNKISLQGAMLPAPQQPDYFLVVVRASEIGRVDVGSLAWRSEGTPLDFFQ